MKSLFEDKMFDTFHNGYSQRILFVISALFIISFSLELGDSAYATLNPSITTDYDSYYTDHGALVNVTFDNSPNPQPTSIYVTVASTKDLTGCTLTFQQSYTNPKNYILSGSTSFDLPMYVMLTTTTNSDCNVPKLAVYTTDKMKITTQVGIGGLKEVLIQNSDDNVSWTVKTTDQPYKKVILSCDAQGEHSGDSICDSWKNQTAHKGYIQIPFTDPVSNTVTTYKWGCNPATNNQLTQNECPTIGYKDIYIEADWFLRHKPDARMISDLKKVFAHAPVSNTNGTKGINLHIILDEQIPSHKDQITAPSPGAPLTATSDFDILKTIYFGNATERSPNASICGPTTDLHLCAADLLTAKRQVFHYAIFAHSQAGGYSGSSELPGNDMMISLGGFTGGVGSLDQLEGTFMHELGHNLNLYHGGSSPPDPLNPDYDNCKPNYLSVMNYNFQFSDFIWNRALNYSGGTNFPLDKTGLVENWGVFNQTSLLPPTPPPNTVYGIPSSPWYTITPVGTSMRTFGTDFDTSTTAGDSLSDKPPVNINNIHALKGACNVPDVNTNNPLKDFNDWNNLLYDMKTSSAFYDGAPITVDPQGVAVDATGADNENQDYDHGHVTAKSGGNKNIEKWNPVEFIPQLDADRLSAVPRANLVDTPGAAVSKTNTGNIPISFATPTLNLDAQNNLLQGLHNDPVRGFIQEGGMSISEAREIRSDRVLSLSVNVTKISPMSIDSESRAAAIADIKSAYYYTKQDALYPALLQLQKARTELSSINDANTKTKTLTLLDDVIKSQEKAAMPVVSYPDAPHTPNWWWLVVLVVVIVVIVIAIFFWYKYVRNSNFWKNNKRTMKV